MTTEEDTEVGLTVQAAEVSRALHSISKIAGDESGPGKRDILFNNQVGIVVPAGFVNALMAQMERNKQKPIATYRRKNGLYVAKIKMKLKGKPGFTRQGANPQLIRFAGNP